MDQLENVIEFVKSFTVAEYRAIQATFLEPDDGILAKRMEEATRHLHVVPGHVMSLGFGRRPGMTPEEVAEDADWVNDYRERTLFQVKRYSHPAFGDLYACFLSSYKKEPFLAYGSCFAVTLVEGVLKIISIYTPEMTLDPGPVKWEYLQGTRLDSWGELVEVRKLTEPDWPAHLADYKGEA
jgi:hypothetical protein